jgi:hypothetical protein
VCTVSTAAKLKVSEDPKADAKKKSKKRAQLETSLSLGALSSTKNLYDGSKPSPGPAALGTTPKGAVGVRMTVEILDDASPDTTPRGDKWKPQATFQKTADELQRAQEKQTQESHHRSLQFRGEKSRVLGRADVFVPGPGVTIEAVDAERSRLALIEESGRRKHADKLVEISARRNYLHQDRMVIKIQALFRGFMGRKRVALTKRVRSMVHGDWIEVRDKKTGEVWYYNTVSGISQWERPRQMQGRVTMPDQLKRIGGEGGLKNISEVLSPQKQTVLPALKASVTTDASKLTGGLLYQRPRSSSMGETRTITYNDGTVELAPALENERTASPEIIRQELEKELRVSEMIVPDSLLVPDGSFKPQLRTTIQDALLQSRFDSVATVLADDRWIDKNDSFEKTSIQNKPVAQVPTTDRIDYSRQPLVAVLKLDNKKKSKKTSKFIVEKNEKERGVDVPFLDSSVQKLTIADISHPGLGPSYEEQQGTMCFACWSTGSKRGCAMHSDPNAQLGSSQTMLLCRNWELGIMRRRYRSEEIQEIFMKKAASLRYDNQRKKFRIVVEQRHAIYRTISMLLAKYNSDARIKIRARNWFKSLIEQMRKGEFRPKRTAAKARILRVKRSLMHYHQVRRFTGERIPEIPVPPVTGYSWPERIGKIQYLFTRFSPSVAAEVQEIHAMPYPVAKMLYQPRQFHLPVPKSIPMPRAEYRVDSNANLIVPSNRFIDDLSPAAWLESIAASAVRLCISQANDQISALTPAAGIELIRRTKYPVMSTVKFATLGRKPTPGMMAQGGLPVEFLVSQLITTYIPPQYGNIMVMDKSAVSPGVSPEISITFESIPMLPYPQTYVMRTVEHPLNSRRSPTIMLCSKVKPDDKYYYGRNRPEQTGESDPHGFRTTAWARHILPHVETDPYVFTPGVEVVSLNVPAANRPVNTHADHTYPFCEPSTRDNTTLDLYHLLLTGVSSISKAQVFTALTVQDPGKFLQQARDDLPLGSLLVSVYRSWAFTQKDTIVEFKSDDGIPYWYHRRTGQTFWERPLYDEEKMSPLQGGSVIDPVHNEEPFTMHKAESEDIRRRYEQGTFRKLMLSHHETKEEATRRRVQAQATAHKARKELFENLDNISKSGVASESLSMVDDNALPGVFAESHDGIGLKQKLTLWDDEESSRGGHALKLNHEPASTQGAAASLSNKHLSSPTSENGAEQADDKSIGMSSVGNRSIGESKGAVSQPAAAPVIAPNALQNISSMLEQMVSKMKSNDLRPEDMLQLGLGVGMALAQAGAISTQMPQSPQQGFGEGTHSTGGDDISVEDNTPANAPNSLPIGAPASTVPSTEGIRLRHDEELKQKQEMLEGGLYPLNALQKAMELKVVEVDLTPAPDETALADGEPEGPLNADEEMKDVVPVLVYPQLSTCHPGGHPSEYNKHPVAGEGSTFVLQKDADTQFFVKGNKVLRRACAPLPVGFFKAIHSTRVAQQKVDYLPQVPNLPVSRAVGRVKPRSAAIDWLTIGFDPWSAGKSPLSAEFISTLATKEEQLFDQSKLAEVKLRSANDGVIDVNDTEGLLDQKQEVIKAARIAEDFKKACSMARHGKFVEVEELMNQPDWNVPMEYQDELGNTLLHIAVQNGNKRMVKLCLRREANVNAQNLGGQTPLHYAFAYGYDELGQYLIRKGGDDSIRNKDGLTCYEGLEVEDIQAL